MGQAAPPGQRAEGRERGRAVITLDRIPQDHIHPPSKPRPEAQVLSCFMYLNLQQVILFRSNKHLTFLSLLQETGDNKKRSFTQSL